MISRFQSTKKVLFPIFIVLSLLVTSCGNREKIFFEETYLFENQNWNFDQKQVVLKGDVDEKYIGIPCKILIELEVVRKPEITTLPLSISVNSPEESASARKTVINFRQPPLSDNPLVYGVEAYSEKYFSIPGEYTILLYNKYDKYDLWDMKSVTVKFVTFNK